MVILGAALDSLILILEFSLIVTIIVLGLVVWKGILSGDLKKTTVWRRPLLIPSFVFVVTLVIATNALPIPMSAYQGTNQVPGDFQLLATFRVYEGIAYEPEIQVRISRGLEPNQYAEVFVNFTQEGVLVGSLFINVTEDSLDIYGGVTRSIAIAPGVYTVTVNNTFYEDGVSLGLDYIHILVNQPVQSSFIPEITTWSTLQFVIGIFCFILILGGACIGGSEDQRRPESWQSKKDRNLYLT
ncbi:MAG: hypothetical protein ACFFDM_11925 [Candidatus Thorarchaeota archaeon]